MSEQPPQPSSPESPPPLRYPEGWREVLEDSDAIEQQLWLGELIGTTYMRCHELAEMPDWANDEAAIQNRWQRAVEFMADVIINPEFQSHINEAEIIKVALTVLQANILFGGWVEEGLIFKFTNMISLEKVHIDLRQLPDEIPNN